MTRSLRIASAVAAGAGVLFAGSVVAAQTDDGRGWLADAIEELVADGTLTPAQADAVEDAIMAARPDAPFGREHRSDRGPGWFARHARIHLGDVAAVIGIGEDDLLDALREGQTIAEVASANGVASQTVVDALVADVEERLSDLVDDGELDAADAAERLEAATERIAEVVAEGFPAVGHHDGHHDGPLTDGDSEAGDTPTGTGVGETTTTTG